MLKGLVKKNNEFIESIEGHWNLNLIQSKIIAYLTSKTHKDDEDFKEYTFPIEKLNKDLGLPLKSNTNLRNATEGILQNSYLEIKTQNGILQTHLLSSSYYDEINKTVTLSFDKKLKPYFLKLKDSFTKYELVNVLKLSSKYAIRIYEFCIMRRGANKDSIDISITIVYLKKFLNISKDRYKQYGHFKDRVLEPSKKEINKFTDIDINIKEVKTGKKITSLIISIVNKKFKVLSESEIEDIQPFEDSSKLLEEHRAKLETKKLIVKDLDIALDGRDPKVLGSKYDSYMWAKKNIVELENQIRDLESL